MSLGAVVAATLDELVECLRQQIDEAGQEAPCFLTPLPGADVAMELWLSSWSGPDERATIFPAGPEPSPEARMLPTLSSVRAPAETSMLPPCPMPRLLVKMEPLLTTSSVLA